ncbi:MAG: alpha amylase N-terminal ig-like domain-containing protein, partial [Verrucomicrobiota bacterium]
MLGARWICLLFALPALVLAQTNAPVINLAGTFNDWNPTNAAYAMKPVGDEAYELQTFFRAGQYKLKFAVNGGWEKGLGGSVGGRLVQSGSDINLVIPKHGAYWFRLALRDHTWEFEEIPLTAPHAVVNVQGIVEVNVPIVLDASESVARPDHEIRTYQFSTNVLHSGPDNPQASVILPREGTYQFTCTVNDGIASAPEVITLKAESSYQLGNNSLRRVALGRFEFVLKTTNDVLTLTRNHDPQNPITNVVLSAGFWRIQYDERAGALHCTQHNYSEFRYRPDEDLILKDRVKIRTVALAGSFNGWSPTATPLTLCDDDSYVAYLRLEDGAYQYKFVINGDIWRPDPRADPDLRVDDGRGGFNSGIFIGERAKSYGAQPRGDVNLAAVRQKVEPLSPEFAEVRLRTLRGDATSVTLELGEPRPPGWRPIPMQAGEPQDGFEWWSATVPVTEPLRYYFTLRDGQTTRRYGDEPFSVVVTNRVVVPEWARHVVWYQIFPDRFRNGTPENDPPQTLPWRWDWYKFAPGETPNEAKTFSPAWYSRRFGGDLQGVIEKLPYLRDLGVTALYFCPVFESSSNHGYDTVDYRHVSRYF